MFKQLLKDCKNNKKIKKDNFYSNRLQKYITNEKEIDALVNAVFLLTKSVGVW